MKRLKITLNATYIASYFLALYYFSVILLENPENNLSSMREALTICWPVITSTYVFLWPFAWLSLASFEDLLLRRKNIKENGVSWL